MSVRYFRNSTTSPLKFSWKHITLPLRMVRKVTSGHRVLDVFLTNSPHIWKPPVVFNGLVRSDHLAVMVNPWGAARPDRSFVYLEMLENTGRFKWSISWKCAFGAMYCLAMISPKRFTSWLVPSSPQSLCQSDYKREIFHMEIKKASHWNEGWGEL